MKPVALVVLVLPPFGCVIPFVHTHREQSQAPAAVQRFSQQAQALARAPGAPSLPDVTRSMSDAIEALPQVKGGDQVGARGPQAGGGDDAARAERTGALARASLDVALEAVRRAKPSVPQGDQNNRWSCGRGSEVVHFAAMSVKRAARPSPTEWWAACACGPVPPRPSRAREGLPKHRRSP
jgi:hypothetical protein